MSGCVIINDVCYACGHHAQWHCTPPRKARCEWKDCKCTGFADEPPKPHQPRSGGMGVDFGPEG